MKISKYRESILKIVQKIFSSRRKWVLLAVLFVLVAGIVGFGIHMIKQETIKDTDTDKALVSTTKDESSLLDDTKPFTPTPGLVITENPKDSKDQPNVTDITKKPDKQVEKDTKSHTKKETLGKIVTSAEDLVDDQIEDPMEDITGIVTQAIDNPDKSTLAEDFYFAWFDVIYSNGIISSIPNLIIRLHDTVDSIDPADLTDIVLSRDNKVLDNSVTYTERLKQFKCGQEDVTDFYFKFEHENNEPGIYSLTGKYKGNPFKVEKIVIESGITDEAARQEDLSQAFMGGRVDKNRNLISVSLISFTFNGLQNTFYQSDLSELKLTRDGEEVSFSLNEFVTRQYIVGDYGSPITIYIINFDKEFTEPGTYVITGKYRGVPFKTNTVTLP